MGVDRPATLATRTQMQRSPLRHLVASLEPDELDDLLARASRACEAYTGRRLVPFTGLVEVHRADGVPADGWTSAPAGSLVGALSASSYGRAAGGVDGGMVRAVWVDVTPARWQEMWTYSDVAIEVLDPAGSNIPVTVGTLIGGGIAPDTGQLTFRLGTYCPVGALVRVTYSGGYTTIPQDLVQACRLMAAADIGGEDDQYPGGDGLTTHATAADPGAYLGRAHKLLEPYRAS